MKSPRDYSLAVGCYHHDYKKLPSPCLQSRGWRWGRQSSNPPVLIIMKLLSLLAFSPFLSLASAACNADNCLRALRGTPTKASAFCSTYTKTTSTATAIATYGSFCSNSPSRVSSACSCVVTSSPTPICRPSPVINAATRNGNFEDYPPPGQGVINFQPPWYFDESGSQNAFGDYITESSSTSFGGAAGTVA